MGTTSDLVNHVGIDNDHETYERIIHFNVLSEEKRMEAFNEGECFYGVYHPNPIEKKDFFRFSSSSTVKRIPKKDAELFGVARDSIYGGYSPLWNKWPNSLRNRKKAFEKDEKSENVENVVLYHFAMDAAFGIIDEHHASPHAVNNKPQHVLFLYNFSDKTIMKTGPSRQGDGEKHTWRNKTLQGYLLFEEFLLKSGQKIVYIAQLGIAPAMMRRGFAERSMKWLIAQYPADTLFMLLTRKQNEPAIKLYEEKINFVLSKTDLASELDYNPEDFITLEMTSNQKCVDEYRKIYQETNVKKSDIQNWRGVLEEGIKKKQALKKR